MLTGTTPDDEIARDFDICLIIHAEHSFNASTFAARVVASTRAHIYASVVAAIGSLSGELHGGANSQVMKNLLEIGDPDKVEEWTRTQFRLRSTNHGDGPCGLQDVGSKSGHTSTHVRKTRAKNRGTEVVSHDEED